MDLRYAESDEPQKPGLGLRLLRIVFWIAVTLAVGMAVFVVIEAF